MRTESGASARPDGNGSIVQLTQVGNTLSWVTPGFPGFPVSGTLTPAGSFTEYAVLVGNPPIGAISGRFMPSGNLLDGRSVAHVSFPPVVGGLMATRCTCDDGNTANGDGCDSECRVEPCWTCSGDPSVCTPAAEDSACEDDSACTTGQTCTSGACGGGSPVSQCVDMTGDWFRQTTVPGSGLTYHTSTKVVQRGTDLIIDPTANYFTEARYVGTIDPASGAFDVRGFNPDFFCSLVSMLGSVAPNGLSYVANGSYALPQPSTPDHCDFFAVSETGTGCGGAPGTICNEAPVGVPSLSRSGVMLLISTLLLSAMAVTTARGRRLYRSSIH